MAQFCSDSKAIVLNCLGNLLSKYNLKLKSSPIKTKAITLVILAILNEQIASALSGDVQHLKLKLKSIKLNIPHYFTSRVGLLALFALVVNTPFNHYGYNFIQKIIKPPFTLKKRALQILASCLTLTPLFAALYVGWISVINSTNWLKLWTLLKSKNKDDIKIELKSIGEKILKVFKSSYFTVVKNSWISSPIFTLIAQSVVPNELWGSFFAICYFVLGTYNNTKVKLVKKEAEKEDEESNTSSTEAESPKDKIEDEEPVSNSTTN